MEVHIRGAQDTDLPAVGELISLAFGPEEGPDIAQLTADLLADPTATPRSSLVATTGQDIVGYVLFTYAQIRSPQRVVPATILAPLAVHPATQSRGIGGRLIRRGLDEVATQGAELAFVLGHPGYYPRYGFRPAGVLGFDAPYPIADQHAEAWMVQALKEGVIGNVSGTVSCATALRDPRHWRE